jgi:DNA-binding CsgD family transcriptional regulator
MHASDLRSISEIALLSAKIQTLDDFESWCRGPVRRFLPYGTLLCAAGQLRGDLIRLDALLPVDYAPEHLALIPRDASLKDRKVIEVWLRTREPQIVTCETAIQRLSTLELKEFIGFELQNIAAHGVIEPDASRATYFSFSRMPQPLPPDIALRLTLLVPHLHLALCNLRALQNASRSPHSLLESASPKLTQCDFQVLYGLMRGLKNADIAREAHRSPHTIKHQLAALMRKLGTGNRAETVAKAVALGIALPPINRD